MRSPIEVEVPLNSCEMYPYVPQPCFSEARLAEFSVLHQEGGALPFPVGRPHDGGYQIAMGWDLISMLDRFDVQRVRIISSAYTDMDMLKLAVVRHAADIQAGWLSQAEALWLAKKTERYSDKAMAEATGFDRSRINRYVKIARSLNPFFKQLAARNQLHYNTCRQLVTLAAAAQEGLAQEARAHQWGEDRIVRHMFFGGDHTAGGVPSGDTQAHPGGATEGVQAVAPGTAPAHKSTSLKQLETLISEEVGSPFEVQPKDEREKAGAMSFSFYDLESLVGIAEKLAQAQSQGRPVKGEVRFEFNGLDQLENVIGGLIPSEDDGF